MGGPVKWTTQSERDRKKRAFTFSRHLNGILQFANFFVVVDVVVELSIYVNCLCAQRHTFPWWKKRANNINTKKISDKKLLLLLLDEMNIK